MRDSHPVYSVGDGKGNDASPPNITLQVTNEPIPTRSAYLVIMSYKYCQEVAYIADFSDFRNLKCGPFSHSDTAPGSAAKNRDLL